jgi:hypothetical protein
LHVLKALKSLPNQLNPLVDRRREGPQGSKQETKTPSKLSGSVSQETLAFLPNVSKVTFIISSKRVSFGKGIVWKV